MTAIPKFRPTIFLEPMLEKEQDFRAVVCNRAKGLWEVKDLNQIAEMFNGKESEQVLKFVVGHTNDWVYPTEFHPKECLGYAEGREIFNVLDGDYRDRIKRVSSRISAYLSKHLYLVGDYDIELIIGFVISTYFKEMLDYAPRLLIRGATNSGKSTLLDILWQLCYRGNLAGNTTEASLFRMISNLGVTPLLDEFQDYPTEVRNGIKKVLKNGNTRGRAVQRVEKQGNNSMETASYDVFAPIAFINQAGGKTIPEEVINRSISITMFSQPDIVLPMDQDHEELREIRDELYTIRSMWIADPDLTHLEQFHEQAIDELQNPDGIVVDGITYHFSNRCRDIMGTMYTVAKMAGIETPIVKAFGEMQDSIIDDERDSNLGRTFLALTKVAESFIEQNPMFTKITDALSNITTSEVADEYRQLLTEEGELSPNEKFSTRIVTNMLKDMGFGFVRERRNNRSLFSTRGLESCFQVNLMKYGSDDAITKYAWDKLKGIHTAKRQFELQPESSSEQPNNLTRIGGA